MKICSLCGHPFAEKDAKYPCRSCPLGSHCNLICCPNCGYQMPEEPQWLISLRRLWKARTRIMTRQSASVETLAMLPPGQLAEIVEIAPQEKMLRQKLIALGLLPGVRLTLLRRFPCYLVQAGHAQIALDRQLAEAMVVQPLHRVNHPSSIEKTLADLIDSERLPEIGS